MGSADPPGKMDEKLKSENMQKEHFSVLQIAPFRSQVFKNFLRLRRQGDIDPPNQNPADPPAVSVLKQLLYCYAVGGLPVTARSLSAVCIYYFKFSCT